MKVVAASDSSVLVTLGAEVSLESHQRVMQFFHAAQQLNDRRIRNIHLAYTSMLIDFDPLRLTYAQAIRLAKKIATAKTPSRRMRRDARVVTIPVCYDAEFAPDLADVSAHAKLPPDEVIRLHSSAMYVAYFLGFQPGFAYLSGLPDALHIPRLATPRKHVAAGSVAIGGGHAGVYPADSPGGWRLIGRTALRMFDASAASPARIAPGDRVQFRPIDRTEFERLRTSRADSAR